MVMIFGGVRALTLRMFERWQLARAPNSIATGGLGYASAAHV